MEQASTEGDPGVDPSLYADFLGPPQIRRGGVQVSGMATKGLLLLGYLVVQGERPHSRSRLATLLWPGVSDRDARSSLRQVLSNLRRDLGDRHHSQPLLHATRTSLQLSLRPDDDVDICSLIERVTPDRQLPPHELEALEPRIRGVFLEGIEPPQGPFEDWLDQARRDAVDRSVRVLGDLAGHRLQAGDLAAADRLALRQLGLRPNHERAFRQSMQVAEAAGRHQDALVIYEQCYQVLLDSLGVRPSPETRELHRRIVRDRSAPLAPRSEPEPEPESSTPIPPLRRQLGARSTIVGRAAERASVRSAFELNARLITLQGPGGVGKSRLAEAIGIDLEPELADGVLWVHVPHVQTAQELAVACLDALPSSAASTTREVDALLSALRDRELLLIFDELELPARLGAHVDLLPAILRSCPGVRVLATSRSRLKLSDEQVHFVEGLAEDAKALFRDRMHEHHGPLAEADEAAAAEICDLVAGVPLTVELAARLTRTLSVQDIARLLPEVPEILRAEDLDVDDRHRSVEAIFQPTWRSLSPTAQQVVARCALFDSPFLLEAGQAIAGMTPEGLAELIDASLIRQATHRRYGVHTFLRQLTLARLQDIEPLDQAEAKHARWFGQRLCDLADRAYGPPRAPETQLPQLVRDEQAAATLVEEDADLQAAVRWWLHHASQREATPIIEAWWRHLRQRHRWVEADLHLALALERHPARRGDGPSGPVYWTFLRGITAVGHFAQARAVRHLEATLELLGAPVPTSAAGCRLATIRFVAGTIYGRKRPVARTPSLTRMSLLSACRTALFVPYVVRRGVPHVAYAMMGAAHAASAEDVSVEMRVLTQLAAATALAMTGRTKAADRLFEAGLARVAEVGDPRARHSAQNILAVRGLFLARPISEVAQAYEDLWLDLPAAFKQGILGMEICRGAIVCIHPMGDLAVWQRWNQRAQRASRGATPAARTPFRIYEAMRLSHLDPGAAWAQGQRIEQEDRASERQDRGHRSVIQCAAARVALRAGELDAALRLVDAACESMRRTGAQASVFTGHLAIGPARVCLAQWARSGALSTARERSLKTALAQLASTGRASHLYRPELEVLRGHKAQREGRTDKALAHWRAARSLATTSGAGLILGEATALLGRHGPQAEREVHMKAAEEIYRSLGATADAGGPRSPLAVPASAR